MAKRRNFSADFRAQVALSAIRGDGTMAELASRYDIHPNVIAKWKRHALAGMKEGLGRNALKADNNREAEIKILQAKVGELIVERDFFVESLRPLSVDRRRQMIEKHHRQLSFSRQCGLVSIARSSYCYQPSGEGDLNLELMRLIDEQYLKTPWHGSRQMKRYLRRQGLRVNRKRIRRLMRKMGLVAVAPAPNTSQRDPQHKLYPYLLRGMAITQPDQVWCADVTYIPMAHGFSYLVAIMDWCSRRTLTWRLSNTLDATFCVEALQEAIGRYGCPSIFNTDQGSQFTSAD